MQLGPGDVTVERFASPARLAVNRFALGTSDVSAASGKPNDHKTYTARIRPVHVQVLYMRHICAYSSRVTCPAAARPLNPLIKHRQSANAGLYLSK